MAKKAYIGIDSVARKIKGGYVGVDGVARKIKKAYIGIGGVARPCWASGGTHYYGEITSLSETKSNLASATLGNKAFFAGGTNGPYANSNSVEVEVYDEMLSKFMAASLPIIGDTWKGLSCDTQVFFVCPEIYANGEQIRKNNVCVYDDTLARVDAPSIPTARSFLGCASINDLAFFGGGCNDGYVFDEVDVYNKSLTLMEAPNLTLARYGHVVFSIGDHVIFAGGRDDGTDGTIWHYTPEAYNASLTHIILPDIDRSLGSIMLAALTASFTATLSNYAIYPNPSGERLHYYNTSLTYGYSHYSYRPTNHTACISINDRAFCLFSYYGNNINNSFPEIAPDTTDTVSYGWVYNSQLTKMYDLTPLENPRNNFGAAKAGNFVIVAGGSYSYGDITTSRSTRLSSVEAYVIK